MLGISDQEYMEFTQWKAQRAAEQAERERRERTKQLQREQRADWEQNRRIDAELMKGVERGLTWLQFVRETAAPGDLQKRYVELQQGSGIAPGSRDSEREKSFLKGFLGEQA